ncbi:MAG: GntR family transcriptional regulator, partial [Vulcanimicrobiaceae bacterium]
MERPAFEGPEPRYIQLADHLTRQIKGGRYGPHARLPSESEIMARWSVSRVTARQSMALLEKRGLAVRRRGVGAFVTGPKVHYDISMAGFYDTLVDQGLNPDVALLDFHPVDLPSDLAAKLQEDTAMLVVRLYSVDDSPLALTYVYLHPDAKRVTREQALEYPAYAILEKVLGYTIHSADLAIRCEPASEEVALALGLSKSDPVV